MKTKSRMLAALLTLAMVLTMLPISAFAEGESQKAGETQIVEHNPREHKGCSVIHQAYGPDSVYLKCTWEEDASGTHQQCEFHDWVLIRIPTISAYYNGQPWTPSFHWQTMRNYPYCELHDGLPSGVSVVNAFIYEGINGTVYGPSSEAPVDPGHYRFYTVIHVPHTEDPLAGISGDFKLEAELHIRSSEFTLSFDANHPDSASTKDQASGTMDAVAFVSVIDEKQLPANQFKLPGYKFMGWNTKADGKGIRYADEEFVKGVNGISKYGEDVTLYAQWEPLEYTITFRSGGDPAMPDLEQTAFFDQPGKLMDVTDADVVDRWKIPSSSKLQGWSVSGVSGVGLFYEDQAPFCNLCVVRPNGRVEGLTLDASFVYNGQIIAVVTKDGVPQANASDHFTLTDTHGMTFRVPASYDKGRYIFDPTKAVSPAGTPGSLPEGYYYLGLEGAGLPYAHKGITYGQLHAARATLDYYTVSARPAAGDKGIEAASVENEQELVAFGEFSGPISTSVKTGYHFNGYSVVGVEPVWGAGVPTVANQRITIKGTAAIAAHSAPNTHTIHFDANTTMPVIGKMEDVAATYDQSQDLPANQFVIAGGTFLGWNTRADGMGVSYADEAEVLNLTSEDGAQVTLYAQWMFNEYKITVTNDGNGSAEANPKSGHIGTQVTLTAFPNTGYKLKEWLVISGDVTFTKDKFTIEASDVEIKAIFDAIPYNISYELNGGTNAAANPATYTIADTPITLASPTGVTGNTFDGWYDDASFNGSPVTEIPANSTGDKTFYAKWTPITVTGITLNSDNAKKIYTEGDALDVTGLTLTVSKSDGSKETVDVTVSMVNGFNSSKTGKQTLTVSYESFDATYEIEVKAKTNPPTTISYAAKDGSGNTIQSVTWQKGSGKTLDLTIHRSEDDDLTYGLFASLEIGGQAVGSANYGAAEGSLKLSIKPEYLENLAVGDHTVNVNFQDGSAAVKLTVKAAAENPKTGDESNLALWSSLMFLSVAAMIVLLLYTRKRKTEK